MGPGKELTLLPNEVTVIIEERIVKVRAGAWKYREDGVHRPGLLRTPISTANTPEDRQLTWYLYGDERYRLCQEIILGSGGLRMLRDLGYSNIDDYHLNEGHAAFLLLELIREMGYENYDRVRERGIFTTHTPVSAGHDRFQLGPGEPGDAPLHGRPVAEDDAHRGRSMTEIALRYSHYINGVSEKHADVSRAMYGREDVDCITNGIHSLTWVSPEMDGLLHEIHPLVDNAPERLVKAALIPSRRSALPTGRPRGGCWTT